MWVAALCGLALLAVRDHARGDSITIDEPLHIFAAAEYLQHGTLATNPEHPPLAKLLAGASLLAASDPRPPVIANSVLPPIPNLLHFFRRNTMPLEELVALARRPFAWLLALLIVVVHLGARTTFGATAAMLASALVALDPNLIAHAGVVHTDIPATLFMTATVVLTLAARTRPALWLAVGLVLGLALASKFTALILVPLVLLAPLLQRDKLREQFTGAIAACVIASVVVLTTYGIATRNMPREQAATVAAKFLRSRGVPVETARSFGNLTFRVPQLGLFASGVQGVRALSAGERPWNWLHGEASRRGFPHYFFVAFLIKSTPAMLLVTVAALVFAPRARSALALLAPVVLLFAISIPSSFNIGVRHILPVYPLLAIVGAGAIASRVQGRAFVAVAGLLIGGAAMSLATSHPYELGYFTGAVDGRRWLSDSNLDWGQDVDRLRTFLRARGWDRDTTVIVLSSPVQWPELARYPAFEGVRPGRYAISAFMEQLGPLVMEDPQLARLIETLHARGERIARVGASIDVWELK